MTERRPTYESYVYRNLWAFSGNSCPGQLEISKERCQRIIVNPDSAELVGEIAHIVPYSKQPGQPRQIDGWTTQQRNDVSNLMLLCKTCHAKIDGKQWKQWPKERLEDIKRRHELKFSNALSKALSQAGLYTDLTSMYPGSFASNGYTLFSEEDKIEAEANDAIKTYDDFLKDLNQFQTRVSKLPRSARSVLHIILKYGYIKDASLRIDTWEPERHAVASRDEVLADLYILHNKDVIYYYSADELGEPEPISVNLGKGHPFDDFWEKLKELGDEDLQRAILDADFTAFDK
ncbi:HNH endonuclease signature motif containing protein [Gordonia sp. ABSL11-1]|uniref:HNH endonuclease signature motif containing protein n=1 Tax=Gordonia sp. ABSL11-1 TaxID=3053924 RepID=UPI0025726531|nr:HNH endonuclease signature motif containing protein [Gordonia sp. ABSL11-1]MDL9947330.1 HNH endonuclease signature motif containing protein [Gordonia sp. ABSL11-1]